MTVGWTTRVAKHVQLADEVAEREGPEVVAIHEAADKSIPTMVRWITGAQADLKAFITPELFRDAWKSGDPRRFVLAAFEAVEDELLPVPQTTFTKGYSILKADGQGDHLTDIHLNIMDTASVDLSPRLDITDPHTVNAARENAGSQIRGMRQSARDNIGEGITRGVNGDMSRREVERLVRSEIGMDRRQARAHRNLVEAGMRAQDRSSFEAQSKRDPITAMSQGDQKQYSRARRYRLQGRTKLKEGMTDEEVWRMGDQYETRAIKHRAETISRTETMRAANGGRIESVRQGQRDGYIPEGMEKIWVTTYDDRTCDICAPLDGQTISIEGPFKSALRGLGNLLRPGKTMAADYPPIHSRCRCTIAFVPIKGSVPGLEPQSMWEKLLAGIKSGLSKVKDAFSNLSMPSMKQLGIAYMLFPDKAIALVVADKYWPGAKDNTTAAINEFMETHKSALDKMRPSHWVQSIKDGGLDGVMKRVQPLLDARGKLISAPSRLIDKLTGKRLSKTQQKHLDAIRKAARDGDVVKLAELTTNLDDLYEFDEFELDDDNEWLFLFITNRAKRAIGFKALNMALRRGGVPEIPSNSVALTSALMRIARLAGIQADSLQDLAEQAWALGRARFVREGLPRAARAIVDDMADVEYFRWSGLGHVPVRPTLRTATTPPGLNDEEFLAWATYELAAAQVRLVSTIENAFGGFDRRLPLDQLRIHHQIDQIDDALIHGDADAIFELLSGPTPFGEIGPVPLVNLTDDIMNETVDALLDLGERRRAEEIFAGMVGDVRGQARQAIKDIDEEFERVFGALGPRMSPPPPSITEQVPGGTRLRQVDPVTKEPIASEWEWWFELTDKERRQLKNIGAVARIDRVDGVPTGRIVGAAPDLLAERVADLVPGVRPGEEIVWWLDQQQRRADLGSVVRGSRGQQRLPARNNVVDLIEGVDDIDTLAIIGGEFDDDMAKAILLRESDADERMARGFLPQIADGNVPPWRLDFDTWLEEVTITLEKVEDIPVRIPTGGGLPRFTDEETRFIDRLEELLPDQFGGHETLGTMADFRQVHDEIVDMARRAREAVDVEATDELLDLLAHKAITGDGLTWDPTRRVFASEGKPVAFAAHEGIFLPPARGWDEESMSDALKVWLRRDDVRERLQDGHSVGVWINTDDAQRRLYLDVVKIHDSHDTARAMSAAENQIAYFDLDTFTLYERPTDYSWRYLDEDGLQGFDPIEIELDSEWFPTATMPRLEDGFDDLPYPYNQPLNPFGLPLEGSGRTAAKPKPKGKPPRHPMQILLDDRYPDLDIKIDIPMVGKGTDRHEGDAIILNMVRHKDPELRGTGIGSAFMRDLIDIADSQQRRVFLTVDGSMGTSKTRLTKWYRQYDFKPNTGRRAQLDINQGMWREPQVRETRRVAMREAEQTLGAIDEAMLTLRKLHQDGNPEAVALAQQGKAHNPASLGWNNPTMTTADRAKRVKAVEKTWGIDAVAAGEISQDAVATMWERVDVVSHEAWYVTEAGRMSDFTRIINDEIADLPFGVPSTFEGHAAATSAMSPLLDYGRNKLLADRMVTVMARNEQFEITAEMISDWLRHKKSVRFLPGGDLEEFVPEPGMWRPSQIHSRFLAGKHPIMTEDGYSIMSSDNLQLAIDAWRSPAPGALMMTHGVKRSSFYWNFDSPFDDRFITLDTWMYRIVGGDHRFTVGGENPITATMAEHTGGIWIDTPGHTPGDLVRGLTAKGEPKKLSAQDILQKGPKNIDLGVSGDEGGYLWMHEQFKQAWLKLKAADPELDDLTFNGFQAILWEQVRIESGELATIIPRTAVIPDLRLRAVRLKEFEALGAFDDAEAALKRLDDVFDGTGDLDRAVASLRAQDSPRPAFDVDRELQEQFDRIDPLTGGPRFGSGEEFIEPRQRPQRWDVDDGLPGESPNNFNEQSFGDAMSERMKADGTAAEDAAREALDEAQAMNRARSQTHTADVRDAIATGKISPEDAAVRWPDPAVNRVDGFEWEPLPEDMFHVTASFDKIEADGVLRTRQELGDSIEGGTGIGGTATDTISVTVDRAQAEELFDGLHEVREFISGERTVLGLSDELDADAWEVVVREHVKNTKGTTTAILMDDTVIRDFTQRYPMHDTAERLDFYRIFARVREEGGGKTDVMFHNNNAEFFANLAPENIAILPLRPIVRGADQVGEVMGHRVFGMGEMRLTTGEIVDIDFEDVTRLTRMELDTKLTVERLGYDLRDETDDLLGLLEEFADLGGDNLGRVPVHELNAAQRNVFRETEAEVERLRRDMLDRHWFALSGDTTRLPQELFDELTIANPMPTTEMGQSLDDALVLLHERRTRIHLTQEHRPLSEIPGVTHWSDDPGRIISTLAENRVNRQIDELTDSIIARDQRIAVEAQARRAAMIEDAADPPAIHEELIAARAADPDTDLMEFADTLFHAELDRDSGTFSAQPGRVSWLGSKNRVHVSGDVVDEFGTSFGGFSRTIHADGTIYNDLFTLTEDIQGEGIGTGLLQQWEVNFGREGYHTMRVHAVSGENMNGGYTWGRYGYTPDDGTMDRLLDEFFYFEDFAHRGPEMKALNLFRGDSVRVRQMEDLLGLDEDGLDALTNSEVAAMFADLHGEDIQRAFDEIPGFGDWAKDHAAWSGSKKISIPSRPAQRLDPFGVDADIPGPRPGSAPEFIEPPARHAEIKEVSEVVTVPGAESLLAMTERLGRDIFEVAIERNGKTMQWSVHAADSGGDHRVINVFGGLIDEAGTEVGTFHRRLFLNGKVHNESLFLDDAIQGQGIGTDALRIWEQRYADAGYRRMTVNAVSGGELNGAYTWVKYGYTPDEGETARVLLQFLNSRNTTQESSEQLADMLGVSASDVNIDNLRAAEEYVKLHGENLALLLDEIDEFVPFMKTANVEWDGSKALRGRAADPLHAKFTRMFRPRRYDDPLYARSPQAALFGPDIDPQSGLLILDDPLRRGLDPTTGLPRPGSGDEFIEPTAVPLPIWQLSDDPKVRFPKTALGADLSSPAFVKRDASSQLNWLQRIMPDKLAEAKRSGLYDAIEEQGAIVPVQIFVPKSGIPEISEGHHRIAVAMDLDIDIPVRWYGPGYHEVTGRRWSMTPEAFNALNLPTHAPLVDEVTDLGISINKDLDRLYGRDDMEALFPEDGSPVQAIPFPRAGRSRKFHDREQHLVVDAIRQQGPVELVDPRMLSATQPSVTSPGVRYYMDPANRDGGALFADADNAGNRMPVIYIRDGETALILSGHHRATAALLQGRPLRAIVVRGGWGPSRF